MLFFYYYVIINRYLITRTFMNVYALLNSKKTGLILIAGSAFIIAIAASLFVSGTLLQGDLPTSAKLENLSVSSNPYDLKGGDGNLSLSVDVKNAPQDGNKYTVYFYIFDKASQKVFKAYRGNVLTDGTVSWEWNGIDQFLKTLVKADDYNVVVRLYHPDENFLIDKIENFELKIVDSGKQILIADISAAPLALDLQKDSKLKISFQIVNGFKSAKISLYQTNLENNIYPVVEEFNISNVNGTLKMENHDIPLKNENGLISFDYNVATKYKDSEEVLKSGEYLVSMNFTNLFDALVPPVFSKTISITNELNAAGSPGNTVNQPPPSDPPDSTGKPDSIDQPVPPPPPPSQPPTLQPYIIYVQTPSPLPAPLPAPVNAAKDNKLYGAADCGGYPDISSKNNDICLLAQKMKVNKIFTGEQFRPGDPVKRYEAALMIMRALKVNKACKKNFLNAFGDVDLKAGYFDQLCQAVTAGVIKGNFIDPVNPTLLPQKQVTFREFSRMLTNGYVLNGFGKGPKFYHDAAVALGFAEKKSNDWFGFSLQFLVNRGLYSIDELKYIQLDKSMSRLEVAKSLAKVLNEQMAE